MDSHAVGKLGEVHTEQYLVEQGYEILARNAVFPGAEIDLIALFIRICNSQCCFSGCYYRINRNTSRFYDQGMGSCFCICTITF